MGWPVEKTPPTDTILEQGVMIHDGGTIEKREMMDNEKEPLFRSVLAEVAEGFLPWWSISRKNDSFYFCKCALSSHTRTVVSKKSKHFQTVGMIND